MLVRDYTTPCSLRRAIPRVGCYAEILTSNFLTPQPFLPKLRLIKHMHLPKPKMQLLVLLLAIAFVGAQTHFCKDLLESPASSHVCPTCSAADSVAPSVVPCVATLVPIQIIEPNTFNASVRPAFALLLSLRAPPSR